MQIIILRNRLQFSGKVKDLCRYLSALKPTKISLRKYIDQNLQ